MGVRTFIGAPPLHSVRAEATALPLVETCQDVVDDVFGPTAVGPDAGNRQTRGSESEGERLVVRRY